MKQFMDEEFLLSTPTASTLYHTYAEVMPIVDYHCHINPAEIANDHQFKNITEVWLGGDHYKWRVMRSNGVAERFITGDASDREKFQAFAEALPKAIGNPMYHWCHLELKRYFDCDIPLNGDTAEEIWNLCNAKLAQPDMSVRGIIEKSNVTTIATTDDPVDSLEYHAQIAADPTCKVKVLPAWRPDKAINVAKPGFQEYIAKLAEVSGVAITDMQSLKAALTKRLDHFDAMGCKASDHGMDEAVFAPATEAELDTILADALAGGVPNVADTRRYQYAVLHFLACEYATRGWTMELHFAVTRNANDAMMAQLGPDTGFDCIKNEDCISALPAFLSGLNDLGKLPRTIIFSLNPGDNATIGTMLGCFQGTEIAGKVQQGSAWWFNDTKKGMIEQMESLANLSLLGNFLGMLTDSRSFLSYTRHEYFRRILCQLIGGWVENGEYPADIEYLGKMVQNICYNNTMNYFGY